MRKFLNYKEEHRSAISVGDVTMTMIRDVTEVVDFGFMKVAVICQIVGKLLFAIIFIMAENRMALIPLSVYPFVMGIFLCCRAKATIETSEKMADRQNDVVAMASEAVANYRLIADFSLRTFMVDSYESKVQKFNKAEVAFSEVLTHNTYLPPWLTTLTIGGYMMMSVSQVDTFGGTLSLGAFLATINIFKEVGVELAEVYKEFMEIQKSVGPLRKVSHFMNLQTDLETRMTINRMRRQQGNEKRLAARDKHINQPKIAAAQVMKTDAGHHVFAVDLVNIE